MHMAHVRKDTEISAREEASRLAHEHAYSHSNAVPLEAAGSYVHKVLQPEPVAHHEDLNGVAERDFAFTADEEQVLFPGVYEDERLTQQDLLRRECELLAQQVLEEDFETTAGDATVSGIAEEMRNLGALSSINEFAQ